MIEASLITAAISALDRAGLLVLFNQKSLTSGFGFNYIYLFLFMIDFGLTFHIPEFREAKLKLKIFSEVYLLVSTVDRVSYLPTVPVELWFITFDWFID